MEISAQISLYPLRQARLSPAIEETYKIIEKNQLHVEEGTMSTIVRGEGEQVFEAIKEAFLKSAQRGQVSMWPKLRHHPLGNRGQGNECNPDL